MEIPIREYKNIDDDGMANDLVSHLTMKSLRIEEPDVKVPFTVCRGPINAINIIVKDRAGNKYYSMMDKYLFKVLKEGTAVEVFEIEGMAKKKFMREYLEFVREVGKK